MAGNIAVMEKLSKQLKARRNTKARDDFEEIWYMFVQYIRKDSIMTKPQATHGTLEQSAKKISQYPIIII